MALWYSLYCQYQMGNFLQDRRHSTLKTWAYVYVNDTCTKILIQGNVKDILLFTELNTLANIGKGVQNTKTLIIIHHVS